MFPHAPDAQAWNDPRALEIAGRATELRARQLADTALVDYRARAHGYLTFLAQLGEGFREPPQVVKADELALQVFWKAPNLSKQRILGRRDTTLLPTDIAYHRDHLGIVQNNFPAIIRLGDGDEVQDVPHPLSPGGLQVYDFAITDSLRITIPGRVISVLEVKVRPKNDALARVIGALYIERDEAQVVRMALSFTRAAFRDRQLEDLFVVLENGLVGTRFWLPRRQEIEIRRTATWLDYPARGIIRGRWEISDYEVNVGLAPSIFVGPEIASVPAAEQRAYRFESARILDSLPPDVRAVTAEEIRRVQAEVRELVREQALRRARGASLSARAISDFARFNRVEGVALGAGISRQFARGFHTSARARYGIDDHDLKSELTLGWRNARGWELTAFYARDNRDVALVTERSGLVNSIAAQEFGSDFTQPFGVEAVGATIALSRAPWQLSITQSHERHRTLYLASNPARGAFVAPMQVASGGHMTRVRGELAPTLGPLGMEARGSAEARFLRLFGESTAACGVGCAGTGSTRLAVVLELGRPIADAQLVTRTIAAVALGETVPVQQLVNLGGPISAPGLGFHELAGTAGLSQRLEARVPVPFIGFSLGRFGRSASRMTLAPFINAAWIGQPASDRTVAGTIPWSIGSERFNPSAGVGALLFFDVLRFDIARGLRDGRWRFYLDVNRAFWGVL